MTSFLALMVLAGLLAVVSFYVPVLESAGPLFFALALLAAFLAWALRVDASEGLRGGGHK